MIAKQDQQNDLPIALVGEDLPIPAADTQPRHQQTDTTAYPGWKNYASQRYIRELATTAKGDIWLATGGGILHWWPDLERYTRYGSEHGLPGNSVIAIAIDGIGQVWAGCDRNGIYTLHQDTWQQYAPLGNIKVCCLSIDADGQLWVATTDGVFGIDSPDSPPSVELPTPGDPPRALSVTNPQGLWLCNAQGIHHCDGETWVRQSKYVRPEVLTLLRQGQYLWLGTFYGLERVDLTTNEVHQCDRWPKGEVVALAPAHNGVWIAAKGRVGLATAENWRPLKKLPLTTTIRSLRAGDEDEVWIGTHDGLWRADLADLELQSTRIPPDDVRLPEGNKPLVTFSNMVQSLVIQQTDSHTEIWMGTAQGLYRWNLLTDTWRRQGQLGQDIRHLMATDHHIWVGSWAKGLQCLDTQGAVQELPGLPNADLVLALAMAMDNSCWAVGMNGLYHHKDQTWNLVLPSHKLSTGWVQTLAQTVADSLWLGTSAGLFRYRLKTKKLMPEQGDISSANVRCLLGVSKDLLWVGAERGLYWGKSGTWELVEDLARRSITALAWDNAGQQLWVGTDRGLFQLTPSGEQWTISQEFTVQTSGLAVNRILTLALQPLASGQTKLWIGTPCGLSIYEY